VSLDRIPRTGAGLAHEEWRAYFSILTLILRCAGGGTLSFLRLTLLFTAAGDCGRDEHKKHKSGGEYFHGSNNTEKSGMMEVS
jgi:hypothetical protein